MQVQAYSQAVEPKYDLSVVNSVQDVTMSSLEIAELTGKRHADVVRDIRDMLNKIQSEQKCVDYKDSRGRTYQCYQLDYRHANILVSGYDIHLRTAIIDRWLEIEKQIKDYNDPIAVISTMNKRQLKAYSKIQGQLADVAEQLYEAIDRAEQNEPKVKFYDDLALAEGNIPLDEVAKLLKTGRTRLCDVLREQDVLMQCRAKPKQQYVERGYFELKYRIDKSTGVKTFSSALVTPAGMKWLHRKWKEWTANTLVSIGLH
ncbi:Rha family transcriptional regulator [Aeromonas jandaei]|nr:Rha family transcriptional regulator [Aeromonas jandaei]